MPTRSPTPFAPLLRDQEADVVGQDETEHGVRALLNLGHTFGHAIEAEKGYGNWLHGEAVAAGMMLAADTALARGDDRAKRLRGSAPLLPGGRAASAGAAGDGFCRLHPPYAP